MNAGIDPAFRWGGVVATVVLAAVAVAGVASPASAADRPAAPGGWVLAKSYPGGSVWRSAPGRVDKTKAAPAPAPSAGNRVSILGIDSEVGCLNPRARRQITPPAGSAGDIESSGRNRVIANYIPFGFIGGARFVDNTSATYWYGSSPFHATSVTLKDTWDVNTAAIGGLSISGGPPGATISFGSGTVDWATTVSNDWRMTHSWNDVRFGISGGSITKVAHNVTGTFQFGSSYYSVSGYASHGLQQNFGAIPYWGGC